LYLVASTTALEASMAFSARLATVSEQAVKRSVEMISN